MAREAPSDEREVMRTAADATGAMPLKRFAYRPYLSGGSVTLDPASASLFALDADNGTLVVVDAGSLRVARAVRICDEPEQVVVGDGGRAFVTCRGDGDVVSVDPTGASPLVRRHVGAEPFGIALSPDQATLLVTTVADSRLVALSARTLEPAWSAALPANPRGVAIDPAGGRAVVAHLSGGAATVVDLRSHRGIASTLPAERDGWPSELFDFATLTNLPTRVAGGAFAVAMSPGGTRAFVPYVLKNDGSGIESFSPGCYGNGASVPSAATVAAVDLDGGAVQRPMPTDLPPERRTTEGDFGMIGKMASLGVVRAAVHDPVRSRLLAVGDGSGLLVAFDTSKADPTSTPLRTWTLGSPARGVAVDRAGRRAFVHLSLDHTIAVVDLSSASESAPVARVVVGRDALPEAVARGRKLFHTANDSRMAGLAGISCTTCHLEGREDGVTWRLDGQPLQTPMLSGRVTGHGPLRWHGDSPDAAHAVREAVTRLRGGGLPDGDVDALVAYLESGRAEMTAPESPWRPLARGREVFSEAGCDGCHDPAHGYTDSALHRVRGGEFRTPSLRGVFLTAPYLHDGAARSLREMLASHEQGNPMAVGNRLDAADQGALEAFVRSL